LLACARVRAKAILCIRVLSFPIAAFASDNLPMELKTLPLRGFPRAARLQAGTRETRSFSVWMRQEERKTIAEEKRDAGKRARARA